MNRFPKKIKLNIKIQSKFYSSNKQSYNKNYYQTKSDLISDLNLKWTIPTSLIIGLSFWFYVQNQLPNEKNHIIHHPLPPTILINKPTKHYLDDPHTNLQLPTQLTPDHLQLNEPLLLIGLGVRTVSFLAIKVYLAGLYVDPRALRALRVIPGWQHDLSKLDFLSPPLSNSSNDHQQPIQGGETLIRNLLDAPVHFAIQIAPVRPTDFNHLRDGFCRSLLARIQLASKAGTISEPELEKASQSINTFRSFFPTGVSVPKGKALTLIRTASQKLMIEYDGKKLGELDDSIIANQLFLAYFADKDPISPMFKESVAEGFSSLYTAVDK